MLKNPQQPWRSKIKLTTRERKLVARVRKRRTKTHKNIVALIARDLRLAIDDPCVNEEVECACRTWEALAADPEPRTPLNAFWQSARTCWSQKERFCRPLREETLKTMTGLFIAESAALFRQLMSSRRGRGSEAI